MQNSLYIIYIFVKKFQIKYLYENIHLRICHDF